MFRKLFYLVSFVLVLTLVGNVSADIQFPDTTGDHLWSTPENWATGALPTLNDGYVRLFTLPGPIIMAGESYVVNGIHLGNNGEVAGALTLRGGTLEVLGALNCGFKGPGTVNMIDGTLTVPGTLKIARDPGAVGHINLDGGTISANSFIMREKEGAVGTMNVAGGMLTLNGDEIELIQGYIDNGWITSYEGYGTLNLDYDVTNPGQTTLTAVHNLKPNPANPGIVKPGEVELSWTLPDPCVPGQQVLVDVYFTDDWAALYSFADPEAIRIVSQENISSVTVQTQLKTQYYWAVDTYIGSDDDPIFGPIFSFLADNAPPFVNAGPDISTFLQDGTRTGPVSGIVTDDGEIQPFTVTWTVLEQPSDDDAALPSAVIADSTALETMVTVSAEGIYILQLEANDGEYTTSDTMTINVHPDDWTEDILQPSLEDNLTVNPSFESPDLGPGGTGQWADYVDDWIINAQGNCYLEDGSWEIVAPDGVSTLKMWSGAAIWQQIGNVSPNTDYEITMFIGRGNNTSAVQVELWAGGDPSALPVSYGVIGDTVGATLIGGASLTPTIAVGQSELMGLTLNTGADFSSEDALWLRIESTGEAAWVDNVMVAIP